MSGKGSYRSPKQLTVAELVALLRQQPQDALVMLQGWCSWELACGMRQVEIDGNVLVGITNQGDSE